MPIYWKNSPEAVKKHISKHILGEVVDGDTRTPFERTLEKIRWEGVFGESAVAEYAAERKEDKDLFIHYKSLPENIMNKWPNDKKDACGLWYQHTVKGYTSVNYWLNDNQNELSHLLIAVRKESGMSVIPTCYFPSNSPRGESIVNTAAALSLLNRPAPTRRAAYALMSPGDDVPRVETNDPVLLSAIEYANRQNVADELKAYAFLARIYFLQYMELSERQRTKKLIYKTLMAKCEKKAFGDEVCFNYGLTSGEKGALRRRQNQLREAIQDKEAQKWFEFEWEENLYEYILVSTALGDGMGFARDYACFEGQKGAVWNNFMDLLDGLD